VSTTGVIETGRRRRRRHSEHFKAEAVGACQQPGVSVAAVALARGLNANMLRRWIAKAERSGTPIAIRPTVPSVAIERAEQFMPLALPQTVGEGVIQIEVRRRGRKVTMQWPASAARECAQLMKELLR
jgi:transposase